ncbi:hypothetical protein ACWEIJ_38040 [Lentzea sp. NPDC004789]
MPGQGEAHAPRLFTPGVAVLLGFVLLVGNPWLNRDLILALSDRESAFRLGALMFSYPSWHVDIDRAGVFLFWFANLRTVLFVTFAVAGLTRVSRWATATAGLFVVTVGMTVLSAVAAGLTSGAVAVALLDTRGQLPFVDASRPVEFFLGQLTASASFGVLFGLVLGAVVATQGRAPARGERQADVPKSLW